MGIGIDLENIDRFRKLSNVHRVADFILHVDEKKDFELASDRPLFLASRFAVKEALYKATQGAVRYVDVACQHNKVGALQVSIFPHPVAPVISLTHTKDMVAAVAFCL